jgi:fumarate reductase flavoprotein subunit
MVDLDGRRFINEMRYPGPLSTAMLELPGKGAFEIFDQAIYDEHADSQAHDGILRILLTDGLVKRSDDLAGLADQLGIDRDGLQRTLEEHASAAGTTDAFGREIARPLVAPFYGIEVRVALYQTQGGVRVSPRAEVLRADGTPIPNLLAGGGMVCGISGPGSAGYMPGNGLITSLGLGYIAGREAVRPSPA